MVERQIAEVHLSSSLLPKKKKRSVLVNLSDEYGTHGFLALVLSLLTALVLGGKIAVGHGI